MRHRKAHKKLGRTTSHRKAMISNVATSLFEHKQIRTTTPKAKEARKTVERLITFAKRGSLADRRQALKVLHDRKVVKNLFDEIAPVYKGRDGGYTRVIKLGRRRGDGAEMAILELVGFEGTVLEKQKGQEEVKAKKQKKKEKEAEEQEKAEKTEEAEA
ncbi:MAG: 50S ribosomal protein L17 [Caldithrix sp.]|nr:MAG: 50S ribosomal protein L17 [Caldithrix sp.]